MERSGRVLNGKIVSGRASGRSSGRASGGRALPGEPKAPVLGALNAEDRKRCVELLQSFRRYGLNHGGNTLTSWKSIWDTYLDKDHSGDIDIQELLQGLLELGLEIDGTHDTGLLSQYLDESGEGTISFEEFLNKAVKPFTKLSGTLVVKVWNSLDSQRDGFVPLSAFQKRCMFKYHPRLQSGASEKEVADEATKLICKNGKVVVKQEYMTYFKLLLTEIDDDEKFCIAFAKMFDVGYIPSYSLKKAQKYIKTKVLGSSDDVDKANKRIVDAFNKFDKDGSGSLDFSEFKRFFESLEVMLSEPETRALFEHYDTDGSGSIEFAEFSDGILKYRPKK
eukprot:c35108_g1_i1.p1 GENE.c35108_g1_i1~~c35108_g1_i1.p1  ORF type:complete len:345 (-),score=56.63 c35108_g1_i1:81-1088(-)